MNELERGLSVPVMFYCYSPGGSVLNHNFLWRVPEDFCLESALSVSQQVVCKIMKGLPVYHTRGMKQEFMSHYGLLMSGTKPYVLRNVYRELTKVVLVQAMKMLMNV